MWFSVVAYLVWIEGLRFVEGLERIEVSWCQKSLFICLVGELGLVYSAWEASAGPLRVAVISLICALGS